VRYRSECWHLSQSGECPLPHEAMQVARQVLAGELPSTLPGCVRVASALKLDRPSARGERLHVAVCEREGRARETRSALEDVAFELPPEL